LLDSLLQENYSFQESQVFTLKIEVYCILYRQGRNPG